MCEGRCVRLGACGCECLRVLLESAGCLLGCMYVTGWVARVEWDEQRL
jgi:hypothetical protein